MSTNAVTMTTTYMGLELKNPLVAGASDLTANMDRIRRLEDAGVSALVTKSLFEEQLQFEQMRLQDQETEVSDRHPMMVNVFPPGIEAGPEEHLSWVEKTCSSLSIPVIASLNAVTPEAWVDYAKALAGTGAAALELNFYASPREAERDAASIESEQVAILREVVRQVEIPVSVKLSPFYANPLNVIAAMEGTGVRGFVLFNRLFQPDIDVERESHVLPLNLSAEGDYKLSLRYTGLLYDTVSASLCSSGGIFSAADVIKLILAGADCVQLVSALYRQGIEHVSRVLEELAAWMDRHGYASLDAFRGKLSRKQTSDPWTYTRAQYVKMLLKGNPLEQTWG